MSYRGISFRGKNKIMLNGKMNFLKNSIKKSGNVRMFFCVFTLLIIFLLGVILPKSANADSGENYRNYFYNRVINNVLSVMKASYVKGQDTNGENTKGSVVLSFLGIDISNPISIVIKEIAYLDKNEVITDVKNSKTFSLNSFNLDDKQVNKSKVSNVVAKLYDSSLKGTLNKAKPRVLIYHSHTSEAYLTSDTDTSKNTESSDQSRSVVAVGDVITENLEKNYGISVIHDKNVNDTEDYKNAYKKSGVTLDKYLKLYEKFDLIIDLHRDSIDNKKTLITKLNGEDVARFMFVVTDKNPRYAQQKKLIDSMMSISNRLYPGLIRDEPIWVYHWGMGFYNQDRSNNALLIEVGANSNSIQEVKNTGKYLSRIIAEQLNGKK
ncbi:stage II sporulation protein P [Clostridium estertheticum]|uniref:Stage II sporulation protein P n=1 Tax=Clostridium estertheticum TaxID=238834 RepID=A0AA47ELU4_9CLOT|nr:stage II sporulation protein P [Clostridium estertheticum]MBU3153564.1 stage II sporulation protein P [Clostridium estertheticum]MBU3200658.1 stage II sporulation protein P [Clostridium estertheticum]WAG60963.1 stage II sporulation protein P [Clostridium estertheticum]WAG64882.1 stage II sporulation protein P [Clostridium estertheticum]